MLFYSKKDKYKKVSIDGTEMLFKCLNYNEVKDLEDKAKEIGEDINKMFFFICDNYVTDLDKNKVIDEASVQLIPLDFVGEVIKKFMNSISGNMTEDEIKKN
jgi:hypothetical protein